MVGKIEVGKIIHSGKLSLENDGLESCSREKDVAPRDPFEISWRFSRVPNIIGCVLAVTRCAKEN